MTDETTDAHEVAGRTRADGDDTGRPGGGTDAFGRWVAETRAAMARADTCRVDVYVRSMLSPPSAKESQRALVDRFTGFEEDSPVQDVTVNVWGERLCLCASCEDTYTSRTAVETVEAFVAWGDDRDATVSPCFERTTRISSVTGNSYEGVVPPHVTAAPFVDGSVRGVLPCLFAGEYYSVDDFCAVLDGATDTDSRLASADRTA